MHLSIVYMNLNALEIHLNKVKLIMAYLQYFNCCQTEIEILNMHICFNN